VRVPQLVFFPLRWDLANFFLGCPGTSIFPILASHVVKITDMSQQTQFIFSLFDYSHSYWGRMISHCGFGLHFSNG
jgi:hypothetical protein